MCITKPSWRQKSVFLSHGLSNVTCVISLKLLPTILDCAPILHFSGAFFRGFKRKRKRRLHVSSLAVFSSCSVQLLQCYSSCVQLFSLLMHLIDVTVYHLEVMHIDRNKINQLPLLQTSTFVELEIGNCGNKGD